MLCHLSCSFSTRNTFDACYRTRVTLVPRCHLFVENVLLGRGGLDASGLEACPPDMNQSTVRKKMAAVHFTKIPCEPNRTISRHRKPYFGEINPCTNKIVYSRYEVLRPLLCIFMSGFRIFVR